MSDQQQTLKWGDVVRIHGVNLSKKNPSKGLVLSKGFTDSNIYYQKYAEFDQVNFYRQSLFQLLPRSNFDVHDQLLNENLTPQNRQILKLRAAGQVEGLYKNLERIAGTGIMYGSQVVFKHVQSNSFLRGIMKAADSGDGAFKIQVAEAVSSQALFRLRSHRSYQHEGDPIYYDDALLIYHDGADCFMNFAQNDQPVALDKQDDLQGTKQPQKDSIQQIYANKRPSIKRPVDKRISIINQNKSKCYWKFILHCDLRSFEQKHKIKSHDIVYFEHTKNKGMISSSLSSNQFFLKESDQRKLYFECFWELIPQEVNQLGPENCAKFWARNTITGNFLQYNGRKVQIQSKNKIQGGGFISSGLVNLVCGRVGKDTQLKLERGQEIPLNIDQLKIIQYSEQKTKKYKLIDVEELKEDSFCIMKVQDQTMMNIQYVVSSHEPLVKFLKRILIRSLLRKDQELDFIKNKNGGKELTQKQRSVIFKDFFFMKLDEDELPNIINIIKLLAGKIYNTNYENIGPSGNTPNETVQKILVQTGITELLVQIIFILYQPFKEIQRTSQPSQDRAFRNKVSEIFQCTYLLLQKIAVGNQDNRIYLSRWVDLFLEHSNNINRSYIQQCLVCILQNNPLSIQATINEAKINELISSFFTQAKRQTYLTIKYLRLFSTFIKCQDRVIKQNQKIILDSFFKNTNNAWSFKFKLEERQQDQIQNPLKLPTNHPIYDKILKFRVQIALGKQDFSSIPKFFKDWGAKWNYFLAYVNLLADICMDRNSQSIDNVSALISLQIVTVILNDPQIRALNLQIKEQNDKNPTNIPYPISSVHQPFTRIAHYVYINNQKFIPVKRIKSISSWYRGQNQEKGRILEQKINKTKRAFQGQKQEQQKCYLMNILSYIEKFIENCDQDHNNLNILLTVLNVLKQTITLGLWESIDQFRKLIPLIIMRINKIDNRKFFQADEEFKLRYPSPEFVKKNKQKLKLNRPQLNLIIQCKIKATDIFKLMNQLEIDIRLRYMMNFFKGLYEATQSFEDYNKIEEDKTGEDDGQNDARRRNQFAKEEFLKNQSASILGQVKKISQDQDIMLKQSIWYNKVKQLTPFKHDSSVQSNPSKDRYLFQGEKGSPVSYGFEEMVLAMFELPVFQNHGLLNASLKMLRQMFEQRKDMIDKFKRILICGKGNLYEVYLTLKYMRQKFNMLTNLNIDKYKDMDDERFPFKFSQTYDSGVKQNSKRSGILQDLFFLARTLKQDINLKNIQSLMLVEDNIIFNKNAVYNHLNEKEKNNNLFQRVNLAEEIYIPLIEYIKIMGRKVDIQQNHRKVLFGIYNYLALLCFNNLEAKQVLMTYIPDVLPHLSLKVGADNFIYQVCVNNKLLVNNEALVSQIIDGALDACIKLDSSQFFSTLLSERIDKQIIKHTDYEKGKIFHSLRGILLYNDQGHKHNQQLLINRLQDNKYKRLIFKGKTEFTSPKKQNFELSPEESYIANHFQLFAGLVQTQNFINIGKLQNIHPYPYCLECLKTTNRWQLRRTIRSYINRLYYVNKDRDIFLFEQFIRKQFKIINEELNDLVQLHKNKLITDQVPIPNGIRFKYALSEILQLILQILITLHEMLLKPQFIKILDRQIQKQQKKPQNQRQIHDQFVKLITHLGCLNKLYPKTKTIAPFIKEVYRHISKVMMKFEVKYLNSKASSFDEGLNQQEDDLGVDAQKKNYVYDHSKSFFRNLNSMIRDIKARQAKQALKQKLRKRKQGYNRQSQQNIDQTKKDLIEQIYSVQGQTNLKPMKSKKQRRQIFASQYKPHIQTANSKIFKVIAKPLLGQNEQNIELNRRLGEVKIIIEDSPSFRKLRDDQFYKLVTTITNINQISCSFYEKDWISIKERKSAPVVNLKQILTNSFKLIMKYPAQINDAEKIFVIKLARCYITEAVQGQQSYKLPVDKWDPDYYKANEEVKDQNELTQFQRRQNLIEDCGGSDFIISLLSQNLAAKGGFQLLNETLLFGISYLFNGNTKCQDSMLKSLKNDPNNSMLISLKQLIKVIGNFLIQIRKIKDSGKERSFAYKIEDTYDYFDSKENTIAKQFGYKSFDKFQLLSEINMEKALCRMFRFLQLFCQNNNVNMKKFLREQINDDQSKKTNTINFIDQATLILRKLFKVMNDKIVSIPPTILQFINEITQMPCIQNQHSFMKSTFFEDISYLADFFEDNSNILLRKFNPVPQEEGDPYNQLKGIYQKGIQLALVNFEGNQNILFWQFLTKCQPKFLWICIKQNLLIMLKQKAEDWGIQKNDQLNDSKAQPAQIILNRQLLIKFDKAAIQQFINSQKAKQKKFRDQIQAILRVLYIVKKIQDYGKARQIVANKDKQNVNKQQLDKSKKALSLRDQLIEVASRQYTQFDKFITLFQDLILSIEVSANNGNQTNNQYIYFPKHPVLEYLAPDTRNDIMMRVIRETQRDKQTSLLSMRSEVKQQINLNYDLKYTKIDYTIPLIGYKIQRDFSITSDFGNQVRGYARKCSFFICLLMVFLILVDHDTEEQSSTFTYSNMFSEAIIVLFCKIQLILTLGFVYIWVRLRKPLALKKYEEANSQKEETSGIGIAIQQKKKGQVEQGWQSLSKLLWQAISWVGSKLAIAKDIIAEHPLYKNTITSFVALFQYQSGFLSILIFVLATFAGNFIGVQWYTIHIFDIFTDISELTNIFKAILDNIQKLTILSILAGVFILVFNVLSLSTYTHVIYEQDLPQEACQQIVDCVLVLYTSGAINDSMDQFEMGRFFFDIGYIVFMEMMFQNIVGGIMMDAFAGLKEQDEFRNEDKQTNCYICGMNKADMQKNAETFDKHKNKHWLWNYIYYILELQQKDPTNFSGIQFDINSKLNQEDVTWFPAIKTDNEQGDVEQVFGELQNTIVEMQEYSNSMISKSLQSIDKAKQKFSEIDGAIKKLL